MKKVVGVRGSRWTPERSAPYEAALRIAGIDLVVVRPGEEIPENVSGLLLMGGADINPALYNQTRSRESEMAEDARDELECALISEFVAQDRPVLAICRGMQILNVQHGGSLIQHLPTSSRHRPRPIEDKAAPIHPVRIVRGTRLASILGEPPTVSVNSRHHQAVDRVGEGLLVSARDPEDGTIEAVERTDRRFVIAVQWHPENQASRDERQAAIFHAFAAAL